MNLPFLAGDAAQGERTVLHRPAFPSPPGAAIRRVPLLPFADPSSASSGAERRRSKLWELGETLHCSIIGTCLSTAELRQVLTRAKVVDAEKASEHELHILGVMAASAREPAGRLLHKALDRRHHGTLTQFAKADTPAALRALWDDAVRKGDIPGAYWAALTHPTATSEIVKHVFGEIHMLSHLVGAANRADIRRLRQLQDDNAALREKLDRQQRHVHEAFKVRDEAVRRLNAATSVQPADASGADAEELDAAQALIADLNRRLSGLEAHSRKLQGRLDGASAALRQAQEARRDAEAACIEMRSELDHAGSRLASVLGTEPVGDDSALDLSGVTLLYVGGRAHQMPSLRALIERSAGHFLHHDGGIDDNAALLPGLVSRADLVAFPVDCISHGAMNAVKRHCGQAGKRFLPLRTSSLTCLLAALDDRAVPQDA